MGGFTNKFYLALPFQFLILSLSSSWTLARRSSSSSSSNLHSYNTDPNTNFIDDPKTSNIDFSQGITNPDGTVCVERQKFIDKTEKNQLKECFVQNVTQCYYTYVTEYTDGEQEKCDEFYWKSCKIVFEQKTFNATSRKCKRPLTKQCDDSASPYGAPETNVVCQTFYETMCNTTDVIPEPGDEPLAVTFCEKFPRKICAPDNCKVVEGFEQCEEETVASVFETPTELCDLQPQKHCSTVKVAVPRLIPEKKCRKTERQICNTQLVNPHSVDKTVFIKYCSRPEKRPSYQSTYLPPPPAQYPPPPPSSSSRKYSQPSAPTKQLPLPAYGPPPIRTSQPPVYSNSLRYETMLLA